MYSVFLTSVRVTQRQSALAGVDFTPSDYFLLQAADPKSAADYQNVTTECSDATSGSQCEARKLHTVSGTGLGTVRLRISQFYLVTSDVR